MIRPDEARQLQPGPAVRRTQHHDLRARVRDAADGVEELALHEGPTFHLEPQCDEERRRPVEIGDRDADVVEVLDVGHPGFLR